MIHPHLYRGGDTFAILMDKVTMYTRIPVPDGSSSVCLVKCICKIFSLQASPQARANMYVYKGNLHLSGEQRSGRCGNNCEI